VTDLVATAINDRWTLLLPEHRACRAEWPTWEAPRLAAMFDRIGPGDVVFDLGAEEGDLPALWATWGADVVCVEPNARVWPNIRTIFEGNDLTIGGWFVGFAGDITAGRQRGGTEGWPPEADGEVIGDHGFCHLWERPDISRITVDDLATLTGLTPSVLTIDVEGSEGRVLAGAAKTLAEARPTVFVSIHPQFMADMHRWYGDTPTTLINYMASLDYKGTHITTDHEEHWRFDG
jgi:FkbM family methyltransferase